MTATPWKVEEFDGGKDPEEWPQYVERLGHLLGKWNYRRGQEEGSVSLLQIVAQFGVACETW